LTALPTTPPNPAPDTASRPTGSAARSRFLSGDAAMASAGMAAVAILVVCLLAMAAWAVRSQRVAVEIARQQQVDAIGTLLTENAGRMLASGELSPLRSSLSSAARNWDLSVCRIVIGKQVIADADPRQINMQTLPEHWSELPPNDSTIDNGAQLFSIEIPGRGVAQLQLIPTAAKVDYWQTQAGMGAGAVTVLTGLMLLYRFTAGKLRPMWLVRDALGAVAAGDRSADRLSISPKFGKDAVAWNALVSEACRGGQPNSQRASDQRAAREQSSELDAACDVMTSGLLLVDARMRAKFANGATAVYLRTRRDQIVGKDVSIMLGDERVLNAVRSIATGSAQGSVTIEVERKDENGSGVLRFTVRPVRKRDAGAAMIVIDDITQQRVADAARNSFVAQVAHELRTPLTNIRLYVETAIEDDTGDVAQLRNALNIVNSESRRLERTVSEMLSVSEIEAGSIRIRHDDVRLDEMLSEVKSDFAQQAKDKNITFEVSLPPKMPTLQGDRDKIVLTVHNLIGNALKYTAKGGRVAVTLDVNNGKAVLDVADSGIGISPEEAELVFDRFYRSKDERVSKITGTGLGLTLAREIARLHGGDVTLQSEINKGSTFTLSLPLAEVEAKAA
jgi:signal transduction histidine kinase